MASSDIGTFILSPTTESMTSLFSDVPSPSPLSPTISIGSTTAESLFTPAGFGPVQVIKVPSECGGSVGYTNDAPPKRHDLWYADESNVEFLIEGVMFKVSSLSFQRGSAVFRDMVARKRFRSDPLSFSSECKITVADFECFLEVLYPIVFNKLPFNSAPPWLSVLRVAHHLDFESIRLLAIEQLDFLGSPIDKLLCGFQFGVDQWLRTAYEALCVRSQPLSYDEAQSVGLEIAIKIATAREAIRGAKVTASDVQIQASVSVLLGEDVKVVPISRPPSATSIIPPPVEKNAGKKKETKDEKLRRTKKHRSSSGASPVSNAFGGLFSAIKAPHGLQAGDPDQFCTLSDQHVASGCLTHSAEEPWDSDEQNAPDEWA